LTISLPICFAQTYQYIVSWESSGQDAGPQNVRLVSPGWTYFSSCTKDPIFDYSICTLQYPSSATTWDESEVSYTFKLFDASDDAISGESVTETMYVDIAGPRIDPLLPPVPNGPFLKVEDGSVNPISSDGIIDIEYRAFDGVDNTPDGSAPCSGIWMVEFYINDFEGSPVLSDEIFSTSCSTGITTRKLSYTMPTGIVKGTFSICPRAYDNFGNFKDGTCKRFTVDRKGPNIKSLTVFMGDEELEYHGPNPIPVTVRVVVEDDDFNPASNQGTIVANLQEICSTSDDCSLTEHDGTEPCVFNPDRNETTCEWDIKLDIAESGNKDLYIDATDAAGHLTTKKFTKRFNPDTESPTVVSIETSKKVGTVSYIGTEPMQIIATLRETKSGIHEEDIELTLSHYTDSPTGLQLVEFACIEGGTLGGCLNQDSTRPVRNPKNCTQSGNNWVCNWDVNFAGIPFSGTAKARISGSDKLGNTIDFNEFDIEVDTVNPKIYISREDTQATDGYEFGLDESGISVSEDRPTIGMVIDFTFNVTEYVTFSVRGDLISTEAFPKAGICEKLTETKWGCTVSITDLRDETASRNVGFVLTDNAGNNITYYKRVSIYQFEEEIAPDVIDGMSITRKIPQFIDRAVISLTDFYVLVRLNAISRSGSGEITILGKEVSCNPTYLAGYPIDVIDDGDPNPSYFSDDGLSEKSIFGFHLAAAHFSPGSNVSDPTIRGVTIPCNMSIWLEAAGKVYRKPQVVPFEVTLNLTDLPLGYVDESMYNKIEEMKRNIEDKGDEIAELEEANELAGVLCTIAYILSGIDVLLTTITTVINAFACAFNWNPAANSGWRSWCSFVRGYHHYISNFVYNPRGWGGPQLFFKILCTLYSGRICDIDFLASLVTDLIRIGVGRSTWDDVGIDNSMGGKGTSTTVYEGEGTSQRSRPEGTNADSASSQGSAQTEWDNTQGFGNIPPGFDAENWLWGDPFKSIHAAHKCASIPATIYNERKLQQVMCKRVTCYETATGAGLPTAACDTLYDQEVCLYYDSAAWTLNDGELPINSDLFFSILILGLIVAAIGQGWTTLLQAVVCKASDSEKDFWADCINALDFALAGLSAICFTTEASVRAGTSISTSCSAGVKICDDAVKSACFFDAAITAINDLIDMFDSEHWENLVYFDGQLEGTDYCSGFETGGD
jgi:hypothetical protein